MKFYVCVWFYDVFLYNGDERKEDRESSNATILLQCMTGNIWPSVHVGTLMSHMTRNTLRARLHVSKVNIFIDTPIM